MATAPESSKVFVLNVHAGYQCRREGACCTAGWHIPIEADRLTRLRAALAEGGLTVPGLPRSPDSTAAEAACFSTEMPPDGAAAVIQLDQAGACVFFDRRDGRLCAIQRDCGHDRLPVACQQFPRVALIDARGTHLTLSHFCPTAARMLFREDVENLSIVVDPPGAIRRDFYEGFDATKTIPPLVRPGLVADLDTAATWDQCAVASLGREAIPPEVGLAGMVGAAERIRKWKPGAVSLADTARSACDAAIWATERRTVRMAPPEAARLFLDAVAAVPPGLPRPSLPAGVDRTHERWIAPVWSQWSRPVGRYLAARAIAAWSAYCGEGLRTQIGMLAVALGVLVVESARQAETAGRLLDADLLCEAIRHADVLLIHLASGEDLARRMSRVEGMTRQAYVAEIGLDRV